VLERRHGRCAPMIRLAHVADFDGGYLFRPHFTATLTLDPPRSRPGGLTTTCSPAFTPARTSTISLKAPPTVTGVSTALPCLITKTTALLFLLTTAYRATAVLDSSSAAVGGLERKATLALISGSILASSSTKPTLT